MATDLSALTVYMPPQLLEILKMRAAADGRSVSNFVQRHLESSFGGKGMVTAYQFSMPQGSAKSK